VRIKAVASLERKVLMTVPTIKIATYSRTAFPLPHMAALLPMDSKTPASSAMAEMTIRPRKKPNVFHSDASSAAAS
jgi:hypothetical protein